MKHVAAANGPGGAAGIAAGTLLSPLLLAAGLNPLVTVASTGMMVMFTSSSTAVQYLILGRLQVRPETRNPKPETLNPKP